MSKVSKSVNYVSKKVKESSTKRKVYQCRFCKKFIPDNFDNENCKHDFILVDKK